MTISYRPAAAAATTDFSRPLPANQTDRSPYVDDGHKQKQHEGMWICDATAGKQEHSSSAERQ